MSAQAGLGGLAYRHRTCPRLADYAGDALWTTSNDQIVEPVAAGRSPSGRPDAWAWPRSKACDVVHALMEPSG